MKQKKVAISLVAIFLIILVGAALRFWRLEQLTTFSGDQGYDFLIVKRMIVEKDFTLLGPKIGPYNEIGNLYLGPAYYYLIAPALFLSGQDPIGPAVFTVILSLLTIIGIFKLASKYFSKEVAILSATLYGTNSFLINQSRAPSNPHLVPFFAIIYLYSILEIVNTKTHKIIWPALAGLSLGIMFQLHYLTISLVPLLLILLAKKMVRQLIYITLAFTLAIAPQILFEIRNKFFITNLFIKQIKLGENLLGPRAFYEHLNISFEKLTSVFIPGKILLCVIVFSLALALFSYFLKNKKKLSIALILLSTILTSLAFASLYSGSIELHYLASAYPQLAILIAVSLIFIFNASKNPLAKWVVLLLVVEIVSVNILALNLQAQEGYTMPKGWNLTGTKKAAKIIAGDVSDSKFNIASTLDGDTRARPFRYLVEVNGKIPQDVEHYPDSETIYLISPDEEDKIKSYTVWEISSFRPFKIENSWQIQNGISLFKLKRSQF